MVIFLYDLREGGYKLTELGKVSGMSTRVSGRLELETDLAYRLVLDLTEADRRKLTHWFLDLEKRKHEHEMKKLRRKQKAKEV